VVGATDSRAQTATVRVIFRQGLAVLADGALPLLDTVAPDRPVSLPLAVPGEPGSLEGKAALVPAGANPAAQVSAAVGDGAAAVLVYGRRLPSGALTGFAVPVIGVDPSFAHATLQAVRRRYTVVATIGTSSTARNGDAGRIASFSSRGLTFGGLLGPELAAPGIAVATSEPGSAGDGEPGYGSVTGTSVAAAAVAGDAALLAQARPGLGAQDLASLLVGSAQPFGAAATAAAGGTADPGASVAGEVAASTTSLSFGPWHGKRWRELQRFTVSDVSTRPLTLSLSSSSSLITVEPATIDLKPGRSAVVRVTAVASTRPALTIVSGAVTVKPAGVQALRIPWVIVFRPFTGGLLGGVSITPSAFSPSDTKPATLTVVAGRIAGGRALQIEPVARLDVLLYSAGGRFLGVLAKQRDLLPGVYRFGLTGRGPGGAPLPAGSYEIRLVAKPVLPGPASRAKITFRIQ
jgi:hypothetical protein